MEIRFLTNVTLLEKDYHLNPPIEFMVGTDPTVGAGHICAENEVLSILEYGRSVKEVMREVKESFERRCRFYADSKVVLTEAQEVMKKVYENLNLEEGHIEEQNFAELGQMEEIFPLADKSDIDKLPGKSVVDEPTDSYYKGYIDGHRDAVNIWTPIVEKLIDKLN